MGFLQELSVIYSIRRSATGDYAWIFWKTSTWGYIAEHKMETRGQYVVGCGTLVPFEGVRKLQESYGIVLMKTESEGYSRLRTPQST